MIQQKNSIFFIQINQKGNKYLIKNLSQFKVLGINKKINLIAYSSRGHKRYGTDLDIGFLYKALYFLSITELINIL